MTCTALDGSGARDTCRVTVKEKPKSESEAVLQGLTDEEGAVLQAGTQTVNPVTQFLQWFLSIIMQYVFLYLFGDFWGYIKDEKVELDTPLIGQVKNNWCWAACALMIGKTLVQIGSDYFMYVVAVGGNVSEPAIVKLQYSGTEYWEVARYKIGSFSGIANMGHVQNYSGVNYAVKFLLKAGTSLSTVTIPYNGSPGNVSSAGSIKLPKSPVNYSGYDGQGIHYENIGNGKIYVPYWGFNRDTGSNKNHANVILVYDKVKNASIISNPTYVNSFEINKGDSNAVKFEVEGCGFRGNTLWFNANEGTYNPTERTDGGIYTDSRNIK